MTLVCLALPWPHWLLALPFAILGAGAFGAAWAFIPGYLQAKRGSHVVITTIMFNFIASALVVYLLVNVLKVPGSMAPETRNFAEGTFLPFIHEMLADVGITMSKTPMNLSSILALIAAFLTWVLIWRTRLGYEMRAFGHSEPAAVYAGIDPVRITIIVMMISGAMAGMMALNVVMGFQHRLVLDYVGGAGFVGIAVSLMGRSHPVGVVLAAILFGILYQGGAELAFEMPTISREMIVVIQALVILFTGALENLVRVPVERALPAPARGGRVMDLDTILQLAGSSLRLATPLLLACLAGLFSERAGIFDIGLEGKMLAAAFAAGAFAAVTGSAWIGLLAGIARLQRALADPRPRLDHAQGQPADLRRRDQLPGLGADRADRAELVRDGRPDAAAARAPSASCRSHWPFAETLAPVPVLGPIYQYLISGHNILVYRGAARRARDLVGALPHPLRPAPARGRREPRRGRHRRRLGGAPALRRRDDLRPALRHRRRLSLHRHGRRLHPRHDRRQGLHRAGRADLRQVAALAGARRLPALRRRSRRSASATRASPSPASAPCRCSSCRPCPTS